MAKRQLATPTAFHPSAQSRIREFSPHGEAPGCHANGVSSFSPVAHRISPHGEAPAATPTAFHPSAQSRPNSTAWRSASLLRQRRFILQPRVGASSRLPWEIIKPSSTLKGLKQSPTYRSSNASRRLASERRGEGIDLAAKTPQAHVNLAPFDFQPAGAASLLHPSSGRTCFTFAWSWRAHG